MSNNGNRHLATIQDEIHEWATRNFAAPGTTRDPGDPFMGMVEELGEMSHALLKQKQGIRGTFEEHEEALEDAIGDFEVYLMDFCALKGIDLELVITKTWNRVKQRNWKKDPASGGEGPANAVTGYTPQA